MAPEIIYRQATLADIDSLRNLAIAAYEPFSSSLPEEYRNAWGVSVRDVERLKSLLSLSACFVCLHGNILVGMAFIVPSGNPWEMYPAEWSYIRMVGVLPQFRGRGLAKTLTRMCLDEARKNGERTVALHTSELMPDAQHIYESAGFRRVRELPVRFGIRYWLYALDL